MDDPGDEIGEGAPSREGPRDWHQTGPPPTTIYQGLCRLLQPKHSFNWNGPWNFTRVRRALQSKRSQRISQEFRATLLLIGLFSLRLDATSEGRPWSSCFGRELGNQTRPSGPSITEISSNDFVLEDVIVLTGVKIWSPILFFILPFSFCKPWLKDFVCGGRTSAKPWAQFLGTFELRTTWQMWPWPAWTGSNFQRIKWSWQHQAQQCEISSEWTPTPIQWSSCLLLKPQ